jgi:hypothetical protein
LYRQTSDRPLPVRLVDSSRKNVRHHKWVFDNWVFEDFRWKVIGNVPVPANYSFPDYLMGDGPTTYGVRGADDKTPFRVTPREIRKRRLEPITILPAETIEANLNAGRDDPWPEMLDSLRSKGVKG